MSLQPAAYLCCINPGCGRRYGCGEPINRCQDCHGLLDVRYEWDRLPVPQSLADLVESSRSSPAWAIRNSGVWKFHPLLPFASPETLVSVGEGRTVLQPAERLGEFVDVNSSKLYLQYEGFNPSGSFKDNGMCAAFTHARNVNARMAACASTGNTSASLAMYGAATGLMNTVIFIGSGKIAYGKLSQALDYGALTIQIDGDFDDAMGRVQEVCPRLGIYLVNSVNPFRLEGQKTIMLRVLEGLDWQVPDWILVPGGNLGNSSSFGKMFGELHELGLISRIPRLAIINAEGASTLDRLYNGHGIRWQGGHLDRAQVDSFFAEMDHVGSRADTLASAIEINRPVNLEKSLRALEICDGVVRSVSEQEIVDAKSQVGRCGFGCEPASAASVAGLKKLRAEQVIGRDDTVVCVLTGHQLKDPDITVGYHSGSAKLFDEKLGCRGVQDAPFRNSPISVANDLDEIIDCLQQQTATAS